MASGCRICMETDVFNNVFELACIVEDKDIMTTCADAILYCLDIQVCQDSNTTTMICLECYRKLISFYNFKVTANESNDILTSKAEIALKANNMKCDNDSCAKNDDDDDSIKYDEQLEKYEDVQNTKETPSAVLRISQPRRSARFKKMQTPKKPKAKFKPLATKLKLCGNKQSAVMRDTVVQANSSAAKKQIPRAVQSKKRRKCPDCGKSVLEAWIKKHMQTHSGNRSYYPCDMCDKKYSTKTAMTKHRQFHHLGQIPICPICNKGFHHLAVHIATSHRAETTRPHACAQCPRRFTSPAALRTHQYKHSGERPWRCEDCGKAFQRKGILIKHKSHSRERECSECGVRARTDAALQRHRLLAHSGDKPFCCSLCERGFRSQKSLSRHIKQHLEPYMDRKSDDESGTFKNESEQDDEETSDNANKITFFVTTSDLDDCVEEYLSIN